MSSIKAFLKRSLKILLRILNEFYPKNNKKVFVEGSPTAESSAVSVANYIAQNYHYEIVYIISDKSISVNNLLHNDIRLIHKYSGPSISFSYIKEFISSKYIFYTHGTFIENSLKRQVTTNIWHGIAYKKVGVMVGAKPFRVNTTVGTSKKTQKMFSESFGVSKKNIFISGFPRNDYLVNTKKKDVLNKINSTWLDKKIIFWLPTFRKNKYDENHIDGSEVGNPFQIKNFNLEYFEDLLSKHNAICLLKPHPNSPSYDLDASSENIYIINDAWISRNGITLYQFMSGTDLLISDVSSVMLDYLFLDNPIICISSDLDEYEKTRGFYFENIEKWIPGPILKDQDDLFSYLKETFEQGADEYEEKRKKLRKIFFKHFDSNSTKRLVEYIFGDNLKRYS